MNLANVALGLVLVGSVLNAERLAVCWAVWGVSAGMMLRHSWRLGDWPSVRMWGLFVALDVWGLWRWLA